MALKAVLDSDQFGELDESTKGLYKEVDEEYVLDIEGADGLPVVKQLNDKRLLGERHRKKAEKKIESYEHRFGALLEIDGLDLSDVDPERIEDLRPYLTGEAEIPTGDGGGQGKTPEEIERIRENARKPVQAKLDASEKKAEKFQRLFQRECVTNTLTAEFSKAGVKDPDFLELLIDRYSGKCSIDIDDDGKVSVVIDSEYGDVSPKEFCKEWAGTDYARKFIASPDNSGGGGGGGGGGGKVKNPWSKDNWNMTEQARIYKADPERAKRMAAEHGKTVGD